MSELAREYLQRLVAQAEREHTMAMARLSGAVRWVKAEGRLPDELSGPLAEVDAAKTAWKAACDALTAFYNTDRVEAVQ